MLHAEQWRALAATLITLTDDLDTGATPPLPRSGAVLTADVVAERLSVSRHRVYSLIRSGRLPGIRMGRQVRVSIDVLDRFVSTGGAV